MHLLAVREVVLGLHRVLDLSLPPGRVVHRYWSRAGCHLTRLLL